MGSMSGFVELVVKNKDESENYIRINGEDFGLEEGGDWRRDPDDRQLYCDFLFVAFCEGFNLMLNIYIHGNTMTSYDLIVRYEDSEDYDIKIVIIDNDELDVSGLFPSGDEDLD
jgi:hypothetical protein